MHWEPLVDYAGRIAPGLLVIAIALAVLPRARTELQGLRIALYILAFVVMRDALTPVGLWHIGSHERALWLRLPAEAGHLLLLTALTAGGIVLMLAFERDLGRLVIWVRGPRVFGLLVAVLAAVVIAAPGLLLIRGVPLPERGGAVPASLLAPLLLFALVGNLLEELLFRGFLQGHLEGCTTPVHAAILSGIIFGAFHAPLGAAVTSVGAALVLFVTYEGLLCAFVRSRYGVIASTIAHGGGIFLLASGI